MATAAFIVLWVVLGLAIFVAAVRSGRGPVFDPQKRGGRRAVWTLTALAVVVFGVGIPVAVGIAGADQASEGPSGLQLTAAEQEGRERFNEVCSQCHTLAAANAVGTVGPNLDVMRPPKELVLNAIEEGRARGQGQMPADLVQGEEAEHVAAFVAKTAGR